MIKAWDADGHVSESEVTFSDKYWDLKLKDRRPSIVETGPDGPLYWMIDTRSFPVRSARAASQVSVKDEIDRPFS